MGMVYMCMVCVCVFVSASATQTVEKGVQGIWNVTTTRKFILATFFERLKTTQQLHIFETFELWAMRRWKETLEDYCCLDLPLPLAPATCLDLSAI